MKNDKGAVAGGSKKSSLEQVSLINDIIKREKKYHSIYTTFTLNLKRCI